MYNKSTYTERRMWESNVPRLTCNDLTPQMFHLCLLGMSIQRQGSLPFHRRLTFTCGETGPSANTNNEYYMWESNVPRLTSNIQIWF